jgi:homoserine dehydrogenase
MQYSDALSPLRIAIAGLGTVGGGVAEMLLSQSAQSTKRAGRVLELVAVSSRSPEKAASLALPASVEWVSDASALATHPNVDVVVELIGGAEGAAYILCKAALQAGKHVITANKALIAHHGVELARIAEEKGVQLQFEAAVAGGIPIIKLIKEGLAANHYQRLIGILNGTCNYILSTMEQTGRSFEEVLAEAQSLGYAEADPAFDIDGVDAAHKLCILSAIAFGSYPAIGAIYCEGIRHITSEDIVAARELGYSIRLIAVTAERGDKIELRVHPALLPLGTPVSEVDGVYNAVHLFADAIGDVFIEGKGAGRYPTASAVMADVIDVARGNAVYPFLMPSNSLRQPAILPMSAHEGCYYLRLHVADNAGILAAITRCFADAQVSIARVVQYTHTQPDTASLILITHRTREQALQQAIAAIDALPQVLRSPARFIRIEED